jgi:hypothetical protein
MRRIPLRTDVLVILLSLIFIHCEKSDVVCSDMDSSVFGISKKGFLDVKFTLTQQSMYQPSFAVWIEEPIRDTSVTLFATCKAAHSYWDGEKSQRLEALPVWDRVRLREALKDSIIDGITSATPHGTSFEMFVEVPRYFREKTVNLYIEANASFDNNEWYTSTSKDQSKVNGQPSVVWKCSFASFDTLKATKTFTIAGCGSQNGSDNVLHAITDSVTTAKDIIQNPTVKYVR